jgi:hypothetical protein
MERLPKDVLGLIFARCRPLELVRLAGVCQWLRRCVLLRVFAGNGVVSCPPTIAVACEALMGPPWSELLECRVKGEADFMVHKEVQDQAARAIARAKARGEPEPAFSRYHSGNLYVFAKRFTKRWFLFRLGVLYVASFAAPHQLPEWWERGKRGHRFSVVGRAEQIQCVRKK